MEVIINEVFGEVERRFEAALRNALPDLSEEECSWRKYMAIGSMVFILKEHDWIEEASGGLCSADADIDGTIRRLIHFMAAGLRAPLHAAPGASASADEGVVPLERSSG